MSLCSLFAGDETFGIDTRKIREVLGERDLQTGADGAAVYCGSGAVPRRGVDDGEPAGAAGDWRRTLGQCCVLVMEDDEAEERFGLWWMRWAAW